MPEAETEFDLEGCLLRVRAQDQSAARELVGHLYPLVLRIVRSHLPRRVQEEDLCQEVFLKLFTRLDQYQGKVPLTHWVSRIAVTTCIDHLRAQRCRPEYRWADLSENEADLLDRSLHSERELRPDDAASSRELLDKLLACLGPKDRLVIQLLDLEQKSVAEIAALTGWSGTMVKVRAFRARLKLRKQFQLIKNKERT